MFQRGHIITATSLIKHFTTVSNYIVENASAILITQKSGSLLVLSTAEMFERLAKLQYKKAGLEVHPACLRDILEATKARI